MIKSKKFTFPTRLPQAVVFDLDGTLLHSMQGLADCAEIVLHQCYGLGRADAREAYFKTSGIPFFKQLECLFPGDARNQQAAFSFASLKKISYFNWPLCAQAKEVLNALRGANIRLALSSNSEEELVKRALEAKGLEFDCVLGYRPECVKGRGHFDFLGRSFNLEPSSMLFVGDSLWDAHYAAESGIPFVAKLGTLTADHFRKDYPEVVLIDSLAGLLGLFSPWKLSFLPQALAAV